eukprot:TRINITY_DN72250_c0_g1_i1.p1 TRINITY_DN72250_c0_g1~~TRINITY_DN72250_c0_g1_i1.p1  ORF type:complete len:213 (-),score=37.64 TRINITY_DN72250_c0_g1_i1:116-706(-)
MAPSGKKSKKIKNTAAPKDKPAETSPRAEAENKDEAQASKKALRDKAIDVIVQGLKKGRGGQETGHRWMPLNWHTEFKPVLGPYKKFVQSCDLIFRVEHGDNPERYTVHLRNPAKADSTGWELELERAWQTYCSVTPTEERSSSVFVERAKQIADSKVADEHSGEGSALTTKRKVDGVPSAATSAPAKKKLKKCVA